jgi:hypothetical protein
MSEQDKCPQCHSAQISRRLDGMVKYNCGTIIDGLDVHQSTFCELSALKSRLAEVEEENQRRGELLGRCYPLIQKIACSERETIVWGDKTKAKKVLPDLEPFKKKVGG